jgi:carbonic anhydrase
MLTRIIILVFSVSLAGCSSILKHRNKEDVKAEAGEPTVQVAERADAHTAAQQAPVGATQAHGAVAAHDDKAHAAHATPEGVAPEKALSWLKNGNTRFLKGWYRKDGKSAKDRARLAAGQKPHTIVLSCSDSRVPPEHLFDQGLGELFTIRVAGEALDSSVIASIEYATLHLGTRLVVVMGHTQCGAVDASITTGRKPAGSPSLDRLVADIGPRVDYATPENKTNDLTQESFDNAKGVAADLKARSEIVKTLVNEGKLKIVSALYNLKTGRVEFAE